MPRTDGLIRYAIRWLLPCEVVLLSATGFYLHRPALVWSYGFGVFVHVMLGYVLVSTTGLLIYWLVLGDPVDWRALLREVAREPALAARRRVVGALFWVVLAGEIVTGFALRFPVTDYSAWLVHLAGGMAGLRIVHYLLMWVLISTGIVYAYQFALARGWCVWKGPVGQAKRRIVVLGVGNILLGDEGVGVHVVKELEKRDLPENVRLVDGGTGGFNLIGIVAEADVLIVVDTLDTDAGPGSIFRMTPEDIRRPDPAMRTSIHDIGLIDALDLAAMSGYRPRTVIIGVTPERIDWGTELSERLAEVVPAAVDRVLQEIDSVC